MTCAMWLSAGALKNAQEVIHVSIESGIEVACDYQHA